MLVLYLYVQHIHERKCRSNKTTTSLLAKTPVQIEFPSNNRIINKSPTLRNHNMIFATAFIPNANGVLSTVAIRNKHFLASTIPT